MKSPSIFERLVLGGIDSYDSNQILILQHFWWFFEICKIFILLHRSDLKSLTKYRLFYFWSWQLIQKSIARKKEHFIAIYAERIVDFSSIIKSFQTVCLNLASFSVTTVATLIHCCEFTSKVSPPVNIFGGMKTFHFISLSFFNECWDFSAKFWWKVRSF